MIATQGRREVKGVRTRGNFPKGNVGNSYRSALANLLVLMSARTTASRVFDTYKARIGERDVPLKESDRSVEELTNGLYEADLHIGLNGSGPYINSLYYLKKEEGSYWVATLDGKAYQDGPAQMWDLSDQEVLAVLEVRKVEK